ncbi:MFS transporter [Herbaspirillum sp. ST 5-3]|uniref:MFS transporter n=1 Tax=Oxalobacteraceae TaxID=75682 RepID=UPI0010A395FD|nr:MFS transporter [Herbaspirillum sp. ST 5-3]
MQQATTKNNAAWKFVIMIGVLSFFADFTYEGSRSILGPYLALLAASATAVGVVTGFGELLGYGLRLVSGSMADRTGQFWPITIAGYIVQMLAVPALALADSWQTAAVLIILERVGKAIRNPPRDTMLSHAAQEIGYGKAFGAHEALDQFGALFGPLAVAGVLAQRGDYRLAFAALLLPGVVCLCLLLVARHLYPHPENMEADIAIPDVKGQKFPRVFWIYLAGAGLVAAGFADFPLIAYHFQKASSVPPQWVPIAYAVAMAVSGTGSLVLGRLFDRFGIAILIPLTIIAALFAPLVFLGGFWTALLGAALWGIGMGVHESIVPAAVAPMVARQHRASAYGLFTAGYGVCWFIGSALIGILYDRSLAATIGFCMVLQLAALPLFFIVRKQGERR